MYGSVAEFNGGKLRLDSNWPDGSHEAHAGKNKDDWFVYIAGGIARYRNATLDSFTFTLCHEFGHQFGGYPFVNLPGNVWNTKEGKTDYYAAFVCARRFWQNNSIENSEAAKTVDAFAKWNCNLAWKNENDRNLCYRVVSAGQRSIEIEAEIAALPPPRFSTPELKKQVTLQCRLDSILQGALCSAPYDFTKIPGYQNPNGINSPEAMQEATGASCDSSTGYTVGLKPACWWP